MLSGEGRRAASILHQTPGWRWRLELCLTERSQQCQSGHKAWFHDRCNRADSDACRRGYVGTRVGDTVRARTRSTARCKESCMEIVTRAGSTACACGLHRQNLTDLGTDRNEIHVDVDSVGENLAENRTLPGDTLAAPPGGVWVAPPGRVWGANAEAGQSYRSCCQSTTTEGCHGTKLD